jgi:hypothetical protein
METFLETECLNPAKHKAQPHYLPSKIPSQKNYAFGPRKALAKRLTGKEVKS